MTIREPIRTVWSGRWLILTSVAVVVFGALFYQSQQASYYAATAIVEVAAVDETADGERRATLTIDANPAVVKTTEVAERAAEMLERPDEAARLASQVDGAFTSDPTRVAIRATTTDPRESQAIANAFAAAYLEHLDVLWAEALVSLDDRLQALRTRYDELSSFLGRFPDDPFAGVERQAVINQYQALSAQKSGAQSLVSPGRVIDPASSALPLGYGVRSIVAVAVLVGLLAGIGLAFARRGLDMRVRRPADAANLAKAPVLAEIYDVGGAQRETATSHVLPVATRAASPFTESIRELRTSAQVALGSGGHRSIVVVTAADPDAPRAFLAANLAASWALSGRSTVAVSGDLRRPQLEELLAAPDGWQEPPSSTNEPVLRPTRVPNLSLCVLPDEAMDPADYLATEQAREYIEGLRDQADIVVIDAPPALAAADATILGGYADGAVVVVSSGRTDREVLAQVSERLRTGDVRVLGVAYAGARGQGRVLYASTYAEGAGEVQAEAQRQDEDAPAAEAPAAEATGEQPARRPRGGAHAAATEPDGQVDDGRVDDGEASDGEVPASPRRAVSGGQRGTS